MSTAIAFAVVVHVAATSAPVASTTVRATKGRSCAAFLFASADARGLPVLLEMLGTGEYHLGGGPSDVPLATQAVAAGQLALLTFNKPGVVTDPSGTGFHINDAVYNRYTPDDLLACATGALAWASQDPHVGAASPVVIHGHSEGAIIAARTLLKLTIDKSPIAARVPTILLSGVPAGAMADIVKAQVEKENAWPAFMTALHNNDDTYHRRNSRIGAATMRALLELPPLFATFTDLARAGTKARIAMFHGRSDEAVPIAMVEKLYTDNRDRALAGEPVLDLSLREYLGGHDLNQEAFHDMTLWLNDAVQPNGYLARAERPPEPRARIPLDDKLRTSLVGTYRISETMTFEVTQEGRTLFGQATGQSRFKLFAASRDLLFALVAPIEIKIERQGAKVTALVLVQNGQTRCPRVTH